MLLFLLFLCALTPISYSLYNDSRDFGRLLIDNSLMPDILSEVVPFISVTPKCKTELLQFQLDFNAREEWPLKMLDASAKIPSGLFRGSRWWTGIPDDCINVETVLPNGDVIKGKYGILQLSSKNTTNIGLNDLFRNSNIFAGLCVPSSCSYIDVNILLQIVPSPLIKELSLEISGYSDEHYQPEKMDSLTQFMIFVCGLILTITILGTLLDMINYLKIIAADKSETLIINHSQKPTLSATCKFIYKILGPLKKILSCFSIFCTGPAFFNLENSESFTCIYGIRFFSMIWIVLHHTLKYIIEFDNLNTLRLSPTFWSVLFSKGDLAVSVFFVLSSMMMSYNLFQRDDTKKQDFTWWKFYARRLWRLSPVYYLCFLLSITILLFFGHGVFWPPAIITSCRSVWWWHFLYLNNIFASDTLTSCWSHSWYLCVEVQLFLLSPLILLALIRSQRFGLITIFITMMSCWIYLFSWLFIKGDKAANIRSGFPEIFLVLFTKPIAYAPSYLIGMLLGYIIFKTKSQPVFKAKSLYIIIWIFVISLSCFILIGVQRQHNTGFTLKVMMYYTLHRSLWSLGTALGIYCCLVGYGGWINSFLSLKVWIPFSRLTYCAYLIHIYTAEMYIKNQLTQINFTNLHSLAAILMILTLTCLISFVITLTFEMPLYNLERILTKRNHTTQIKDS